MAAAILDANNQDRSRRSALNEKSDQPDTFSSIDCIGIPSTNPCWIHYHHHHRYQLHLYNEANNCRMRCLRRVAQAWRYDVSWRPPRTMIDSRSVTGASDISSGASSEIHLHKTIAKFVMRHLQLYLSLQSSYELCSSRKMELCVCCISSTHD